MTFKAGDHVRRKDSPFPEDGGTVLQVDFVGEHMWIKVEPFVMGAPEWEPAEEWELIPPPAPKCVCKHSFLLAGCKCGAVQPYEPVR